MRHLIALLAAASLSLFATAASASLTPVASTPTVQRMSAAPNPPAMSTTNALGQYTKTCYWSGYSYRSTLSLKWTSYNGVKYLTRLDLTTNYPHGSYVDVTWGGKTGRVSTGSGTSGVAHFSGWVAGNGTAYSNRHAFSVPLSVDTTCRTSGTV